MIVIFLGFICTLSASHLYNIYNVAKLFYCIALKPHCKSPIIRRIQFYISYFWYKRWSCQLNKFIWVSKQTQKQRARKEYIFLSQCNTEVIREVQLTGGPASPASPFLPRLPLLPGGPEKANHGSQWSK